MNTVPKPVATTRTTVTLSRTDWNGLIQRLEEAEDRAALRKSLAREKPGKDDALPLAAYRRLRAGEHPVRVWREHRGLGLNHLARKAAMSPSYLSEIETGAKPGSATALKKLAAILDVDMDELVREQTP